MSVEGARELIARLESMGKTQAELKAAQIATVAEAKRTVPRRTGHLGRSIVPGRVTAKSALVEARTPYAAAVEFGTRPHTIRPKTARVLAWGGDRRLSGRLRSGSAPTHFAKEVHHPGTRPQPYLIPAAKKAVAEILEAITKRWNDAA